ncbi:TolC family protein [Aporhodopirellula aestuarii]|uniref:TolC family protein n=1 Tax=Aporhodopirellula aestuarii TaxID=2950107 RepID=A0ABT0U7G9_9BACT|nr:TolC family protein [Aporhodopirellula aestuarii]MCM2372826.1 TolC family protein [Aporhodopirellula aestuarii]
MKLRSGITKVRQERHHRSLTVAATLMLTILVVPAGAQTGQPDPQQTETPDDVTHLFLDLLPTRPVPTGVLSPIIPARVVSDPHRATSLHSTLNSLTATEAVPRENAPAASEIRHGVDSDALTDPVPIVGLVEPIELPVPSEVPNQTPNISDPIVRNFGAAGSCGLSGHPDVPAPIQQGPFVNQLNPYRSRAADLPNHPAALPGEFCGTDDPKLDSLMWWEALITQPLGLAEQTFPVDVCNLAETSLIASPYVRGLLTEPKIRWNDMVIADAEFDCTTFIESKFARSNDPVGSILTTGDSSDRFLDNLFTSAAGVRKRYRTGGDIEVVQRGGFQDNNSTYLTPNPQGTSRLEINFSQPLLRDHGRAVNTTRVLLAQINVQLANSETRDEVERHLLDVTKTYWELYQARAEYLQRKRLLHAAEVLHAKLLARGAIDSQQRQILRAEVAITQRRSDLIRIETRIRNSQSRLRMLTADPNLMRSGNWELLPEELPIANFVEISPRSATLTALDNRPDIAQSLRQIEAVSSKVGAAKNQVLPRLDLLLSSYVAGLDSRSDTLGAIANQFTDGGPGYAAGFVFELPVGNRAARARLQRNQWELNRSIYEFQQTTESAITTVEIAVRETQTAYAEMTCKRQSLLAATREVVYLQQRWQWLPDPTESAVLLIEDLLDAQERVAEEEQALTRAQVAYAVSWITLHKAMGILLQVHTQDQLAADVRRSEQWFHEEGVEIEVEDKLDHGSDHFEMLDGSAP